MMSSQVDLGLGYPTFTTAIDEAHVKEQIIMMGMPFGESGPGDAAYKYIMQPANQQPGMVFVEVTDTRSGSHLGYIFTIDEQKVFCINAAALHFVPHGSQIPEKAWQFLAPMIGDLQGRRTPEDVKTKDRKHRRQALRPTKQIELL